MAADPRSGAMAAGAAEPAQNRASLSVLLSTEDIRERQHFIVCVLGGQPRGAVIRSAERSLYGREYTVEARRDGKDFVMEVRGKDIESDLRVPKDELLDAARVLSRHGGSKGMVKAMLEEYLETGDVSTADIILSYLGPLMRYTWELLHASPAIRSRISDADFERFYVFLEQKLRVDVVHALRVAYVCSLRLSDM
jgi:hypothetical protein